MVKWGASGISKRLLGSDVRVNTSSTSRFLYQPRDPASSKNCHAFLVYTSGKLSLHPYTVKEDTEILSDHFVQPKPSNSEIHPIPLRSQTHPQRPERTNSTR